MRRATDDQEPSLARELSQSAVALAAGIDGPFSKYDPIRNAALKKIRTRFTPNELADVVNAYAEAGVKAPDLFETALSHRSGCRHLLQTTPATWPSPSSEGAVRLRRVVGRCFCSCQYDSNVGERGTPLCYASHGKGVREVTAPQQPRRMRDKLLRKVAPITRFIIAVLLGVCRSRGRHSVLFNECTKRVARCANDFTGKQLVTIAFAASKKRPSTLYVLMQLQIIAAKTDELNPQGLSNAAFAYATVRRRDPILFAAVARAAPSKLKSSNLATRITSVVLPQSWFQGAAALRRAGSVLRISLE